MKCLVFVGYFEYILDAVKKYCDYIKVIIIDENINCNLEILSTYFDKIISVKNTHNEDCMVEAIEIILSKNEINTIYATNEGVVEICGFLREKYNIQGMKKNQAINVRDKYLMKKTLIESGIKTARVCRILCESDLVEFIANNEFPIVIKPQDGSACQNTYVINNNNELEKVLSYIDIYNEKFIVESYINGEEYHCDSIVVDGKVIFSSVGKYLSNPIDTINSDKPVSSIIFPALSDDGIIRKIKILNEKVASILRIEDSILHLEVFITGDGELIFGEIAARIGGGPLIGKSIKYCYNIDLYEAFVDIGVNNYNLPAMNLDNKFVGFMAFPTFKGKVKRISTKDEYLDIKGVKEVEIFNKIGDFIDDKSNTTKRTGFIIVEDEQFDNLQQSLIRLYKNFTLEVGSRSSIRNIFG